MLPKLTLSEGDCLWWNVIFRVHYVCKQFLISQLLFNELFHKMFTHPKEGRKEGKNEGVMDERTTDVPSLQYVNSKLWRQHTKAPLAATIMRLLCSSNPWCEWCVRLTTKVNSGLDFWTDKCKCCEMGPMVFHPYPRRLLRNSNHLQMSSQRQHFLLSHLKTPSVGPVVVQTCNPFLSRPALSQLK